jgi:hypothetical protein
MFPSIRPDSFLFIDREKKNEAGVVTFRLGSKIIFKEHLVKKFDDFF